MTMNTAILPNLSYVPKQADHDELASAKLWAVYISEAEKYDKALVESWKSDMDGLLIFAGLFSASLTAFLVESYKTLSPDQGAMTIALLAQISRQLDASSSTTSMATINPSFTAPSGTTLACNILWFLSLGLSLSCALFATLVQQWARDFIQRTEMRPSPATRARIFSYLYFGMQRFGMHTIVGFIPLLLHLSLLLFFTGLVAFLKPINQVMVIVAALMLGLISAIYICLTILPIISSDVPYQTPLSNVVWQVYQRLSVLLYWSRKSLWDEEKGQKDNKSPHSHNQRPKRDEECGDADREPHHDIRSICTLVAVMNQHATECSPQRDDRDVRAIIWTLKSLTDNDELQPFVEALPDLIWGPNGRRRMYDAMINMLLADRNIRLVQRIEGLLQSCDSGVLRPEHEMLRRIACIKALWAIAYFLASDPSTRETFPDFDMTALSSQLLHPNPTVHLYSSSAFALVQWIGFCAVSRLIQNLLSMLTTSPAVQDPGTILTALHAIEHEADARGYTEFSSTIPHITGGTMPPWPQLRDTLGSFEDKAYDSFMEYIQSSARLDEVPFEFQATCEIIQPLLAPTGSIVRTKLVKSFNTVIDTIRIIDLAPEVHQLDIIVHMVLRLLQKGSESMEIGLGRPIVYYIVDRSSKVVNEALQQCNGKQLSLMLTKVLESRGDLTLQALVSIWTLCVYHPRIAAFDEQTLAIARTFPEFAISPCVIAVLALHILGVGAASELSPDQARPLVDRLQISLPIDLAEPLKGAPFAVLIDWLKNFSTSCSRQANTFIFLSNCIPEERYPISFQQRFTTWLVDTYNDPSISSKSYVLELVGAIERWLCYQNIDKHFDDIEARQTLGAALEKRLGILTQDGNTKQRRYELNIVIARLKSSVGVDHRPENFVSVDQEATT
ncbi:hypothetical protein C8J57DRAFT_1708940 [Mycena rebaudengoi]|nr:hypothetical protein C8J57DRAFT_1708940 [Mycena rebaudengoi]